MTVGALIALTRSLTEAKSSNLYDTDAIVEYLQEGYKFAVRELDTLDFYHRPTYSTITMVAEVKRYALPGTATTPNWRKILRLSLPDSRLEYFQVDFRYWPEDVWHSQRKYYIDRQTNEIVLFDNPYKVEDWTLMTVGLIEQITEAEDLTAHVIIHLPPEYVSMVGYKAAALIHATERSFDASQYWDSKYEEMKKQLTESDALNDGPRYVKTLTEDQGGSGAQF